MCFASMIKCICPQTPSATQGLRAGEREGGGGENKEEWEKQSRGKEEDKQK